jgi:hypothetical protein
LEDTVKPLVERKETTDASTFREVLMGVDERCPTSYSSASAWAAAPQSTDPLREVPDKINELVPEVGEVCQGHGGAQFFNWDWGLKVGDNDDVSVTDPSAGGEWQVRSPNNYQWSEGKYRAALGTAELGAHPLALGPNSHVEFLGMQFPGWGSPNAGCADIVGQEICSPTSWPDFVSTDLLNQEPLQIRLTVDGFVDNPACQD